MRSAGTVTPDHPVGKYHAHQMTHETLTAMDAVVCHTYYQSSEDIALELKETVRGVERKLRRLLEMGMVERIKDKLPRGGFRYLWKKYWANCIDPPLYPPQPGLDMKTLADCFGGYTFLNKGV